jgi:hypothetical protein
LIKTKSGQGADKFYLMVDWLQPPEGQFVLDDVERDHFFVIPQIESASFSRQHKVARPFLSVLPHF